MRARLSAALTTVALLCGCASTVAGTGQGRAVPVRGSATTATSPVTSAATSAPTSASTVPSGPAAATSTVPAASGAATPCPQSEPTEVVACLQRVLSYYWSGQLNRVVTEPILLDPVPSTVPARCRPGIQAGSAITCKSNLTLYISTQFLDLIEHQFSGPDVAIALASVASHEFGHVLQYTLHQPQIEQRRPTDNTSLFIEQQADCLSGVWASAAAAAHALDADRFVTDAVTLITAVSSNPEIATHGTPPQRRAAIERGLAGGSPGVCRLVTFH
jgi:predicted metalloprotease